MGHARKERGRIAAEHRGTQIELQGAIAMQEALKQPCTEESRAARNKDAAAARPLPERRRVPQNMVEIVGGQWLHAPQQ